MRNKIVFSSLMVALIVSGCAKRPNAVVPASLPSQTYANYNCKQLNELLLKEQTNEKALASKQRGAADADLRPNFHPVLARIYRLIYGSMQPCFAS